MDTKLAKKVVMVHRQKRGRRWDAPLSESFPPTNADFISAEIRESLRLRPAMLRRRKMFDVPTTVIASAVVWQPPSTRTRIKPAFLRRGHRFDVVPVGADILFGLWKPSNVRSRVRVILSRRGKRQDVIVAQVAPTVTMFPPMTIKSRRVFGSVRRGRSANPPWIGAALNAFIWYPKQLPRRVHRVIVASKRGKRFDATPTQVVLLAPQWPPKTLARRARLMFLSRRGKFTMALTQGYVPTRIKSRTDKTFQKRGRRISFSMPQSLLITRLKPRRVFAAVARGRKVFVPIFVQPPPPVGSVWRPGTISSRHLRGMLRIGRRVEPIYSWIPPRQFFGPFIHILLGALARIGIVTASKAEDPTLVGAEPERPNLEGDKMERPRLLGAKPEDPDETGMKQWP